MTTVYVLEKHGFVREGICTLVKNQPGIQIHGEFTSAEQLVESDLQPDAGSLLITTFEGDVSQFAETVRPVTNKHPQIKLLYICDNGVAAAHLQQLLNGFAMACLALQDSDELLLGIRKINYGLKYLSSSLALRVLEGLPSESFPGLQFSDFSVAERKVMALIVQGLTNREIALQLATSIRTIETQRSRIMKKTNSFNTASLVKYAIDHQLVG